MIFQSYVSLPEGTTLFIIVISLPAELNSYRSRFPEVPGVSCAVMPGPVAAPEKSAPALGQAFLTLLAQVPEVFVQPETVE